MASYLLTCKKVGTGDGMVGGFGACGASVFGGTTPSAVATPDTGSTFAGWSCVGTGGGGFSYSTASDTTNFQMPTETVTCTATFNLNTPPVSAPVDSPLALSLVFLGIAAVAGFQRWRKRV